MANVTALPTRAGGKHAGHTQIIGAADSLQGYRSAATREDVGAVVDAILRKPATGQAEAELNADMRAALADMAWTLGSADLLDDLAKFGGEEQCGQARQLRRKVAHSIRDLARLFPAVTR